MTQKLEGFLDNKEQECVDRHGIKEEKKAESLDTFMAATEKKINLKNKKTKLKKRRPNLKRGGLSSRLL